MLLAAATAYSQGTAGCWQMPWPSLRLACSLRTAGVASSTKSLSTTTPGPVRSQACNCFHMRATPGPVRRSSQVTVHLRTTDHMCMLTMHVALQALPNNDLLGPSASLPSLPSLPAPPSTVPSHLRCPACPAFGLAAVVQCCNQLAGSSAPFYFACY